MPSALSPSNDSAQLFEQEARRFDRIYVERKSIGERVVDALFRRVIRQRFELAVKIAGMRAAGWSCLDVGCGPGRYAVEAVRAGAGSALGVEPAPTMVALALENARAAGVDATCRFVTCDFESFRTDERFDVLFAMGYFDYMRDPAFHLRKMRQLSKGILIASFPRRWTVRSAIRKARFLLNGVYLRYYEPLEIDALLRAGGWDPDRRILVKLSRDWFLVAYGPAP